MGLALQAHHGLDYAYAAASAMEASAFDVLLVVTCVDDTNPATRNDMLCYHHS